MTRAPRLCRWVTRRLAAFVGKDLAPRAADRVRVHLHDCPACRRDYAGWLRARRALRSATVPVGGRFFDELHHDIVARLEPVASGAGSRRWIASAAAALLFGVGLAIGLASDPIQRQARRGGAGVLISDAAPAGRLRTIGSGLAERQRIDRSLPFVDHTSQEGLDQLLEEIERNQRERAAIARRVGSDRSR